MHTERMIIKISRHRLVERNPNGFGLGQEKRLDQPKMSDCPPNGQKSGNADNIQPKTRTLSHDPVATDLLFAIARG